MALKKLPKTVSNCGEELASVGVRLRLMLQDKGLLEQPVLLDAAGASRNAPRCALSDRARCTCAYVAVSRQECAMDSLWSTYRRVSGERFPRGAKRMCKITFTISLSVLSEIW